MSEQDFSEFAEPDQQLLQELSQSLQQLPELQLPADFAETTAQLAKQRLQQVPTWKKSLWKARSWLNSSVTSPEARLGSTLLLLGSTGLAVSSFKLFGLLGVVLALCGGLIKLLDGQLPAPSVGQSWKTSRLTVLYYLTPLLASLTSSLGFAGLVGFLSTRNFESEETVMGVAAVSGLVFFIYLQMALTPLWTTLLHLSLGRFPILLLTQLGFACWLAFPLQLWASLGYDLKSGDAWGVALTPALLTVALLARKPRSQGALEWGASLRDALGSLLLGGVPIFGLLFGFYQLNLTRTLNDPKAYQQLCQEYEQWQSEQLAVPSSQNGWMHLKDFMLKNPDKPHQEIVKRLRQGGTLYENRRGITPLDKDKHQQAQREFVQELPRIEKAMASPQFSWVTPETLKPRLRIPNLFVARSVSQGITSLAFEELDAQNTQRALQYILLNLKWSSAFRQGNLVQLMVGIAQLHIAFDPVERWILTSSPNEQQLRLLAEALDRYQLTSQDFQTALKHEAYLGDQLLTALMKEPSSVRLDEEIGYGLQQGLWFRLIPRSFWESERKLYLNQFLDQLSRCGELGRPEENELSQNLRYSVVALMFPSSSRAQIVFTIQQTKMEALRAQVALERFRLQEGHYPQTLRELIPNYLDRLPVDAVHPNVWSRKPTLQYRTTAKGYELVSNSPLYQKIRAKSRQVFGHDGRWEQEVLETP